MTRIRTDAAPDAGADPGPGRGPSADGAGAPEPWADERFGCQVLEALPGAAFVIDGVGTIRFATETAAALVGREPREMIGQSVLSYVDAQTSWAYAASVAMATDYPTVSMGPLRVTFTSATGERTADLWATNRLDDPAIQGIVCLLTDETAAMGLGDAVSALANNEPLDEIIRRVANAMQGHPVVGAAAVVLRDQDAFRTVRATGPAARPLTDALFVEPDLWQHAIDAGQRRLCPTVDSIPPSLHAAMADAGFEAVWVEPIAGHGEDTCQAALVIWRVRPGNPSPNQLNSIHQAAGILSIALRLAVPDD